MKTHIRLEPSSCSAVKILIELHRLFEAGHGHRILTCEISQRSGYIGLRSAFYNCSCHIVAEIVHVAGGHYTISERFCHCQHRCPVYGITVQLVFEREYLFVQPVLKGHVFSVPPHQRHRRMSVGVVEPAHEQLASAVVYPFSIVLHRHRVTYISYLCSRYSDTAVFFRIEIFIQNSYIFKNHISSLSSIAITSAAR